MGNPDQVGSGQAEVESFYCCPTCYWASQVIVVDLSAALDPMDHDILITRLKHCLGISGTALRWIQSYLSGRTQFVKIGTERSSSRNTFYSVPQGQLVGTGGNKSGKETKCRRFTSKAEKAPGNRLLPHHFQTALPVLPPG